MWPFFSLNLKYLEIISVSGRREAADAWATGASGGRPKFIRSSLAGRKMRRGR
ncbi:MAG: hypothetical protein LBP22_04750 [Deltaproteobacteria bacterium]|nr:hypothetical protein [Deltaproteobacteria bacterium]